jgi:hypothetical protein
MTPQSWIDKGYKLRKIRPAEKEIYKLADIFLQKRIDDEQGKKYFIDVYGYDWTNEPRVPNDWHFMPTVQYREAAFPTITVTLHEENIEKIEKICEHLWESLQCPYYEPWEDGESR